MNLDRDLSGGLISADEADYARARNRPSPDRRFRVMAAGAKNAPARDHRLDRSLPRAVPVAHGLCLYMNTGRPDLPSQPLEARLANPGNDMARSRRQGRAVSRARTPTTARAGMSLAPIYFSTMRIADAETAYRNAIRLLGPKPRSPRRPCRNADGDGSNGVVTEDARKVLERSLALEPDNPRARFYIASRAWSRRASPMRRARPSRRSRKQSPADAPWLPLVNEHIAKNGGTPPAAGQCVADDQPPGQSGRRMWRRPNTWNSGDRQQMIRGMVESLDAELTEDPENFEGWMRLVRSYAVLNDKDRAGAAP